MAGAAEGETFVGENATKLRGLLRLRYPMAHGVVEGTKDSSGVLFTVVFALSCRRRLG